MSIGQSRSTAGTVAEGAGALPYDTGWRLIQLAPSEVEQGDYTGIVAFRRINDTVLQIGLVTTTPNFTIPNVTPAGFRATALSIDVNMAVPAATGPSSVGLIFLDTNGGLVFTGDDTQGQVSYQFSIDYLTTDERPDLGSLPGAGL